MKARTEEQRAQSGASTSPSPLEPRGTENQTADVTATAPGEHHGALSDQPTDASDYRAATESSTRTTAAKHDSTLLGHGRITEAAARRRAADGAGADADGAGSGAAPTAASVARGGQQHGTSRAPGRNAETGAQLGAAGDLTPGRPPPSNKPADWATMTSGQRRRWKRIEKNKKERDQDGEGGQ